MSGAQRQTGRHSSPFAEGEMSPTVFKEAGYRFFFFSREEERMHVHVVSADGEAKFWLEPEIELAKNYKFSKRQLRHIESVVEVRRNELASAWQRHFRCGSD